MAGVRRVPPRPAALFLACIAAVSLTAASCGDDSSGVSLGAAARATVVEVVDAPAAVTARAAATLSAPADGTLSELRVTAGARVRSGQVLAVIDSPSAQDRLKQARRALSAARRSGGGGFGGLGGLGGAQRATDRAARRAFAHARAAANRITDPALRKALLAQVTAAQRQYAAATTAAGQAIRGVQRGVASLSSAMGALSAAQRLQAQQAYDLASSGVDALTLRAPIAGVVQLGGPGGGSGSQSLTDLLGAASGALPGGLPGAGGASAGLPSASGAAPLPGVDGAIPVGGRVTAGTAVLTVVDLSDLGLLAEVDETDVLLVKPGGTATVELDAARGVEYQATVRSVDVLPTQSTRGGVSYRVRLSLRGGRSPDGTAAPTPRPGMSAVAHLQVRQAADAVTVPAAAVFSAEGRDAVWVVRDGKAERVDVTVGVQGQDLVQIVSGLADGQQVVVRGTDQVHAGQEIP
jgi:HlyD family secretion protein